VFVVASARKDINPTEILFESEGVRRDIAPSRKEGKVTPTISSSGTGVSRVGFNCEDEWFIETPIVGALDTECGGTKMNHQTANNGHLLASRMVSTFTPSSIGGYREGVGTLRANGGDVGGGSENLVAARMVSFGEYSVDGTASAMKARDWKDATDLVAQPIPLNTMALQGRPGDITGRMGSGIGEPGDPCPTLTKAHSHAVAQPMAFDLAQITSAENRSRVSPELPASTLAKNSDMHIASTMAVRRLTPTECERLQGFPDGYTNIPWRKATESPDGPRYKALGNSWAVPVVRWIGQRIQDQINAP
jgi:DNA (cytosine-5)-methyltransferase 1